MTEKRLEQIIVAAGQQLKYMRLRAGFTQKSYVETAGCSETTYQRIEAGNRRSGKKSPSFPDLVEAFYTFGGTDQDAAILFGRHEPRELTSEHSAAYDDSEAHLKRLKQYASETKPRRDFTFYYASNEFEENGKIKELKVSITGIEHNSYVSGDASLEDLTYECKLVSPPEGNFTFMYCTCAQGLVDRALFIMPHRIGKKFYGGLGVVISISNDDMHCPMLQKFVAIRDNKMVSNIVEWLKVEHSGSDYVMRFPRLFEKNASFVKEIKSRKHMK